MRKISAILREVKGKKKEDGKAIKGKSRRRKETYKEILTTFEGARAGENLSAREAY